MGLLDATSVPKKLGFISIASLCNPPSSDEVAERSTELTCVVCQESFPRPSDLRAHGKSHNAKQAFACAFPGCLKKYGATISDSRSIFSFIRGAVEPAAP
ncbi:hypothetical protein B0H13DRAFT_2003984 [Mycena leptocephala]|nr:hypothetical protein B0H13DRAFT_2003984 [Mycena leptocephala]